MVWGVESSRGGLASWLGLLCPLPVAYGWFAWRGSLCFRRSEPQGKSAHISRVLLNGCYSSLKKVVPFKLHSLRAWPLVVLLHLHDKLMVADKRQYSMYLADEAAGEIG